MPETRKLIRFDWAIKRILRDKANFDVLEGFLSTLLKEEIKIESLLESESNSAEAIGKITRVDLLVKDSNRQTNNSRNTKPKRIWLLTKNTIRNKQNRSRKPRNRKKI